MGYDPKERSLDWGDVGAGYLVTVAAVAGMALLLGTEAPGGGRNGDGTLVSDTASVAFEDDKLTSRSEVPPPEADEDATDTIRHEVLRSCPWAGNPKNRALRYLAG